MATEKLPDDLVVEILCRLPVKSLLRFKSVCRNWYALILNPSFISLHHNRIASIAAAQNTDCLLVKRSLDGGDGKIILSLVPDETPTEDIDISFTGLGIKELQLLGPCNGVVCLRAPGYNSTIVICNPSIREFRVLPQPSYINDHFSTLGFGFDPSTNVYKVVQFGFENQFNCIPSDIDGKVEIYELSTDSWRIVDAVSPVKFGFHCFACTCTSWNGDFYWYALRASGGRAIIVFHMSDEEFSEIPVPEFSLLNDARLTELFVVNDSLALLRYPSEWIHPAWLPEGNFLLEKCFDIWVMDAHGVEVSWTKKFTITPLLSPNSALGLRQNGEFLLDNGGQMISYHIDTRQIKEYQVCGRYPPPRRLQLLLYFESLVSVKRHNQREEPNGLDS